MCCFLSPTIWAMEVRGADRIALDEVTLADSFKAAGYATELIGKWHNDNST